MNRTIEAIYENGVLRPLEPLDLEEQEQVSISIIEDADEDIEDWLDYECLETYAEYAENPPSLEEVRKSLASIEGSMTADFIAERDER